MWSNTLYCPSRHYPLAPPALKLHLVSGKPQSTQNVLGVFKADKSILSQPHSLNGLICSLIKALKYFKALKRTLRHFWAPLLLGFPHRCPPVNRRPSRHPIWPFMASRSWLGLAVSLVSPRVSSTRDSDKLSSGILRIEKKKKPRWCNNLSWKSIGSWTHEHKSSSSWHTSLSNNPCSSSYKYLLSSSPSPRGDYYLSTWEGAYD